MLCLLRQNTFQRYCDYPTTIKLNLEKLIRNEYTKPSRGGGEIRVCRRLSLTSIPTFAVMVLVTPHGRCDQLCVVYLVDSIIIISETQAFQDTNSMQLFISVTVRP